MNRPEYGFKTNFQIQPMFSSRDQWEELAVKEGFTYEVLELSIPPAIDDPELFRDRSEWYKAGGRVTSLHGAFMDNNPGSNDRMIRAVSRERCEESCVLAVSLGAKNVVFHSACFPFIGEGFAEAWAAQCAGFYEEIADRFDLNIFIENSIDVEPGPIKALMKRITGKRVGVCLDIGHVNYSRCPLECWFEELHDWIGYIHLSDNNGLYDNHLGLGQGTVDWEKADRLWRGLGVSIPVTIETKSVQLTAQSVDFLKEHNFFQV